MMSDPLTTWLVEEAWAIERGEDAVAALGERLRAAGLPVWRVSLFIDTLHPEIMGAQYRWIEGEGTAVNEAPYSLPDRDEYRLSPVLRVKQTRQPLRRRLAGPGAVLDFPVLENFRAQGASDYFAVPLFFSDGEAHVATFVSRAPAGFGEDDLATLLAIRAPLARNVEVRLLRRTAITLLDAYVGHEAGGRILSGRIRRGDVETIRAVLWLSDMRGFTGLSERLPPPEVVGLLNRFFDAQVPAIRAQGGEVLKFMGDGLLAIFRLDPAEGAAAACARALAAARSADAALARDGLRYGLGLHLGEMLYGNIGGGGRLDFTCIGPAVNLVARLERLAGRLGRAAVCSRAFAAEIGPAAVALGDFDLPGVSVPEPAFGLREGG